jgi:hypothetical protein
MILQVGGLVNTIVGGITANIRIHVNNWLFGPGKFDFWYQ